MHRKRQEGWADSGGGTLLRSLAGLTAFGAPNNYIDTAANVGIGDAAGFGVALMCTIATQAVPAGTRRGMRNRTGTQGHTMRFTGTYSNVDWGCLLTTGASVFSPASPILAGDLGKVLLVLGVMDGTTVRLWNKAAQVGAGTAMGGIAYQPAVAVGNSLVWGQQGAAEWLDNGAIVHGSLYFTGVPSAGDIATFYDRCKRLRRVVAMPGVTNVDLYNAQSWVDSISSNNGTISGSLTPTTNRTPVFTW